MLIRLRVTVHSIYVGLTLVAWSKDLMMFTQKHSTMFYETKEPPKTSWNLAKWWRKPHPPSTRSTTGCRKTMPAGREPPCNHCWTWSVRRARLENVVMLGIVFWMFGYIYCILWQCGIISGYTDVYIYNYIYILYMIIQVELYILLIILNIWYHIHNMVIAASGMITSRPKIQNKNNWHHRHGVSSAQHARV